MRKKAKNYFARGKKPKISLTPQKGKKTTLHCKKDPKNGFALQPKNWQIEIYLIELPSKCQKLTQ